MTFGGTVSRTHPALRSGSRISQRTACTSSATLFRRLRRSGDGAAREALVRRFLPLARRIARRYSHVTEPQEDLVQVASLALVKAIDRFDPGRGASFQAFAVPTISGELKRYFRDAAWSVHVPRRAQERALAIDRAAETLTNGLGRPATVEELSGHLGCSVEDVLDGLNAGRSYEAVSLEAHVGMDEDGDLTVAGTLGEEDERYELIEAQASLAGSAECLPDLERRVVRLRFGGELTQSEIAARVGVSQMQVSRLLRRALERMRTRAGIAEGMTAGRA
jgi:RNA polymerase sigma-B factor